MVVCPVLARPANAEKIVASLRETSDARLLFVCSPNDRDQIVACNQTGEDVLLATWEPGPADFARKTNLAFRETDEEWLFLGADDLRFNRRWDAEALAEGQRRNAGVVGTQDLGNPWVKKGMQSTHSLVRRSYIAEEGGSLDGPGTVYSQAYDHQWVDCELVEVAKVRKRFAFARRSIVEHLHPHWGKGEMDATYEKAVKATKQDMALYQQRMRTLRNIRTRQTRRAAL